MQTLGRTFAVTRPIDLRILALVTYAVLVVACAGGGSTDANDSGDAVVDVAYTRWTCPRDWVPTIAGGCGPAVVVCASDGGAAPGACADVDVSTRRAVDDPDAGPGVALYRASNGALAGGWHEDGEPDGYPAAQWLPDAGNGSSGDSWSPDAGVPSCPPGWIRNGDATCDPVLREDCPANSGAVPGGTCTRTADADCPATAYPDPGARSIGATVVHVAAGADASLADGSEAHPFATLGAGIAAAGSAGFVLVAAGRYVERLDVSSSVHVLGVCASRVECVNPSASEAAVHVSGEGTSVELSGLSISGSGPGIAVDGGAIVAVSRVVVGDVSGPGVVASGTGTRLDLSDAWIRDTHDTTTTEGIGISSVAGASVTVSRATFTRTVPNALSVGGPGSTLHASDIAVLESALGVPSHCIGARAFDHGAGTFDRMAMVATRNLAVGSDTGASVELHDVAITRDVAVPGLTPTALYCSGASIVVDRTSIHDMDGNGFYASACNADVRDSTIEHLRALAGAEGHTGYGVSANGTALRVRGTIFRDMQNYGVLTNAGSGESASATIESSVVDGVAAHGTGAVGGGLTAAGAAPFVVRNVLVRDVAPFGIGLFYATRAEISDVVVRDVHEAVDIPASALMMLRGAHAVVSRVAATNTAGIAIVAQDPGTDLVLDDARITTTTAPSVNGAALSGGIFVQEAAHGSIGRTRIENVMLFGVSSTEYMEFGTSIDLHDSAILGVVPIRIAEGQGLLGAAAGASTGASLRVQRTLVADAGPLGIFAGDGSHAAITDTAIRDMHAVADGTSSAALYAYSSGSLDGTRVVIERAQNTGVIAWSEGAISLSDTIVSDIREDSFGFGTGISSSGTGMVTLARVAVLDARGTAMMAAPFHSPDGTRQTGARIVGEDVYVAGVRAGAIRVDYDEASMPHASTTRVAYGVHAGAMCSADIARGVFASAGYGLYASSGALSLHDGVIAFMRDGAGARSGAVPVTEHVGLVGNASDAIVERNDLPEGAMLPSPQPACTTAGCL